MIENALFCTIVQKLADPKFKKRSDALQALENLSREFHRLRNEGKYFTVQKLDGGLFSAPEKGMLGYLGYHVGESPKRRADGERQIILKYVLEEELPPLVSQDYCEKWGAPTSAQRKNTLVSVIRQFVNNASTDPNKRRAVKDWQADLHFLESLCSPDPVTHSEPTAELLK